MGKALRLCARMGSSRTDPQSKQTQRTALPALCWKLCSSRCPLGLLQRCNCRSSGVCAGLRSSEPLLAIKQHTEQTSPKGGTRRAPTFAVPGPGTDPRRRGTAAVSAQQALLSASGWSGEWRWQTDVAATASSTTPAVLGSPQAQHASYRVPYFLLELPVKCWGHRPGILPRSHHISLSASSISQPTSTFSYALYNSPYTSRHTKSPPKQTNPAYSLSRGVGRTTPAVGEWGFPTPPSELLAVVVCPVGDSHKPEFHSPGMFPLRSIAKHRGFVV